jgi:hypothetical protein
MSDPSIPVVTIESTAPIAHQAPSFADPVPGLLTEPEAPVEGSQTLPVEGAAPVTGQEGQTPQPQPVPAKTRADYVREKQERTAAAQQRAMQGQEAKRIAELQAQQQQQQARYDQLETEARSDPLAFLRRYGHTFDDIARKHINMPAEAEKPLSPREQKLQSQLDDLAKWRSEQEQQRQQAQQQWQQQQATQWAINLINEQHAMAAKTPDEFELVAAFPDQAKQLFEREYVEFRRDELGNQRLLSQEEMTKCWHVVEDQLLKKYEAELAALEKGKRFSGRFAAKAAEKAKETAAPTMRTITNDAARPIPAPASRSNGTADLTAEQIRAQHEEEMKKDPRFVKFFAQ